MSTEEGGLESLGSRLCEPGALGLGLDAIDSTGGGPWEDGRTEGASGLGRSSPSRRECGFRSSSLRGELGRDGLDGLSCTSLLVAGRDL